MGIQHVEVQDFQSIEKASLALGRFTVIVGPSNSGKSALLRAIKTLAYNASSPAFVRQGAKTAVMTANVDALSVALERGKSVSTYGVQGEAGEEPAIFAKAGTSVPTAVQMILRFVEIEGEPLNFAFQFDRPYLVSEPGSKVAKIIGDLSNINLVYETIRELNRRRLETNQREKIRVADEVSITEKLNAYVGLKGELKDVEALRARFEKIEKATQVLVRVRDVVNTVQIAQVAMQVEVPEAVDTKALDEVLAEYEALVRAKAMVEALALHQAAHDTALAAAREDEADAVAEAEAYEAGLAICPVCGRQM